MSNYIEVNDVCNLGCAFCGIARQGDTPAGEVERQLLVAAESQGDRITFGGGEPTLDSRLPRWVARAAELGIDARQVETNGMRFADPGFTTSLREAGLTHARVMLPAATDQPWGSITRTDTGLELAWRGARALVDAGVETHVVVPVCQGNVAELSALVDRIASTLSGVGSVTLRPVFFQLRPEAHPSPTASAHDEDIKNLARAQMVPIAELAPALAAAVDRGASHDLPVHLDVPEGLPLCSLRHHPGALAVARPPRAPRGSAMPDGCHRCAMLERCGGQGAMDSLVHGPFEVRPFERIPPALVRNKTTEPIMLISPGMPSQRYGEGHKAELRIIMPCNQNCTFCFVNREAPNAPLSELESAVDEAAQGGVRAIVFTGGEPTLSPHLPALLSRARDRGVPCRGIQTNGLLCADEARTQDLVAHGLNHAHVSLHAADPARYLAITGFGTPDDAAAGTRSLINAGVEVSISLVINGDNVDHLDETLTFLHRRLSGARVVLSIAREQLGLNRPWDRTLVRYEDAGDAIVSALDTARALGMVVESAGTCSMPPCMLPDGGLERHADAFLVGHRAMTWEGVGDHQGETLNTVANEFVPVCDGCALRARCPGIQRTYLERHGPAGFQPLSEGRVRALGLTV